MSMNSSFVLPQFYYEILFVKVRTHVIWIIRKKVFNFHLSGHLHRNWKLEIVIGHIVHCSLFHCSLSLQVQGSSQLSIPWRVLTWRPLPWVLLETLVCDTGLSYAESWTHNLQSMLLRNSPSVWAMSVCQVAKALNFSSFLQINKNSLLQPHLLLCEYCVYTPWILYLFLPY